METVPLSRDVPILSPIEELSERPIPGRGLHAEEITFPSELEVAKARVRRRSRPATRRRSTVSTYHVRIGCVRSYSMEARASPRRWRYVVEKHLGLMSAYSGKLHCIVCVNVLLAIGMEHTDGYSYNNVGGGRGRSCGILDCFEDMQPKYQWLILEDPLNALPEYYTVMRRRRYTKIPFLLVLLLLLLPPHDGNERQCLQYP